MWWGIIWVVAVGLAVWWVARKRWSADRPVSKTWLAWNERLESTRGWDGPRWRTPAERREGGGD